MWKLVKGILGLLLLVFMLAVGITAWQGYQMYAAVMEEQPLEEKIEEIRQEPGYTTLAELPETYLNAVVATEDHRFFQHPGIDIIAIGRAMKNNILAGSLREGGSTITQQLARNLYFTQEKKFTRKAAEMFLAFKLEKEYTKEEILELYVNTIYFGDGYYGIGAASQGYFEKEPSRMDDWESAMLAGLPNAPSAYALTENPELARQRQQAVLKQMVKYGFFTSGEAREIASKS